MLPIRKILCPTDFSQPSQDAVEVARELATYLKPNSSCSTWLRTFPPLDMPRCPPISMLVNTAGNPSHRRKLPRGDREFIKSDDLKVRSVVRQGNASDEITERHGRIWWNSSSYPRTAGRVSTGCFRFRYRKGGPLRIVSRAGHPYASSGNNGRGDDGARPRYPCRRGP